MAFGNMLLSVCRLELSGSSIPFKIWVSKCEISQIGLDKCEFAQNICLSLPKTANNLPECP